MSYETKTDVNTEIVLEQPRMYSVVMLNDDYTTMEFVVEVLMKVFHKSSVEASHIMMEVHNNGQSVVGTYTYDIAITKKIRTEQMAKEKGYPLKLTIDEAIE